MKVILLENLKKIGTIGEIINVKRGFARNYLIANHKALFPFPLFVIPGLEKLLKTYKKN